MLGRLEREGKKAVSVQRRRGRRGDRGNRRREMKEEENVDEELERYYEGGMREVGRD